MMPAQAARAIISTERTDEQGNEIISIMFEMKNEGDETASKKKNEEFLKELDKDRNQKVM
jgi:hypothetical protein